MVAALLSARSAVADPDVFNPHPIGRDIVVRDTGERSQKNVITLAAVAAGGALVGGIGVYYHLDSRDAANAVSADSPTNLAWGAKQQADYDRADSSKLKAEIFYGVGGALLIGAIVGYIVTAPEETTTVIHPHMAPTQGGAILGAGWSF